ncbi:hypothetical protein M7I_2744 [Glarea lozoyensis 74030]|nr:hypothetical protein M7I_2744 [Glarea lozoyensis 74030]
MLPWWYDGKIKSADFHLGRRSDFYNDLGPFEKDGLVQYIRVGSGVEKPGGVETLAKFLETGEMDDPTVKIKTRKRGPMLISFKDNDSEFEEAMMAFSQSTTNVDLQPEVGETLLNSRRKGFRSFKITLNHDRTDQEPDLEIDNGLLDSRRKTDEDLDSKVDDMPLESRQKGFGSQKNLGILDEDLDPEIVDLDPEIDYMRGFKKYTNLGYINPLRLRKKGHKSYKNLGMVRGSGSRD